MKAKQPGGFTLIELIISVALTSVILAAGYTCLQAGLATRKTVETRNDMIQRARVALALMSADFRSACPLSREDAFLGMHRTIDEAEADNADFATHQFTPQRAQEGDFCEISYFLDKSEEGELVLWRRRDSSPDKEPLEGGVREEIIRGVTSLRLEYYDGLTWFDEWGDPEKKKRDKASAMEASNLSGMPEAVRITLVLDPVANRARPGATTPNEPPLAFQTVARLNLTPFASLGSSGGEATVTTTTTTGQGENQ